MSTQAPTNLVDIARQLKDRAPSVDPITEGAINHFELCYSLCEAYPMQFAPMAKHMQRLREQLEQTLLATAVVPGERALEIPCASMDALADPSFAEFIQEPCPIIFRGAARDTRAVRDWTPAFFGKHYGDFPCLLATRTEWDIRGTLGDAVDDILNGKEESRYAHNIANIFNQHPDLEAQLELGRFLPHLGPGRHFGTHLFLGGSRTGTAFHCANNLNVFFNIHGEKEWYFVHPKHSFWMYGKLQANGAAAESNLDHNRPASEQRENFPLFEQVPVYWARLGPGDVLINPPWWWHAINNVTLSTIACAVRWIPRVIRDANPVYSLAQRLVPHAKEVMKVMRDPKARFTDELYREAFDVIKTER